MSFKVIIGFFIGVAIYVIGLLIFVLIKRAIYKKKLDKETKEKQLIKKDEKLGDEEKK